MNLLNQLQGNFPKTIDKSKPVFRSLIANNNNNAVIQKQLIDLFYYMKEWISTPDVYEQTGIMLDKTIRFFSFIEPFADETEKSLKNRFRAIFVRNHDTKWGTPFDVKNVFKQYFPHAIIYLVENTNKIDDSNPDLANLLQDGDIDTDTPSAWTLVDCDATTEARFSKAYGIELNQSGGYFSQTITVPNKKQIEDTEDYESCIYFLHFFLSGKTDVQIYNSANSKYWNDSTKAWQSTAIKNTFSNSEWNDCSLYFKTEGDDDTTDITVTFFYNTNPVASELTKTNLKGILPIIWALNNCTEYADYVELIQSDSTVSTTENILPKNTYKLDFAYKGKIGVKIQSDNNRYFDVNSQTWNDDEIINTFNSPLVWEEKSLSVTTKNDDSSLSVIFEYIDSNVCLKNQNIEGALAIQETLTDCTEDLDVIKLEQMSSTATYVTDVLPEKTYNLNFSFMGRTSIVIQNDNGEYWDINGNTWQSSSIENDVFFNKMTEKTINIAANSDTTELTITFGIPFTYLDYFRMFAKQAFASFTVIAHFEGNTAVGAFGLAPGDDDPNPLPQPEYSRYGYYDKSFLSGVPVGFASDIYEDLLDYLRAQGVKAYLDIVIRDYSN